MDIFNKIIWIKAIVKDIIRISNNSVVDNIGVARNMGVVDNVGVLDIIIERIME